MATDGKLYRTAWDEPLRFVRQRQTCDAAFVLERLSSDGGFAVFYANAEDIRATDWEIFDERAVRFALTAPGP